MLTAFTTNKSETSITGDITDMFGLITTETTKLEQFINGELEFITMLMFVETTKFITSTDGDNTDSTGLITTETTLLTKKDNGFTDISTGLITTEINKSETSQTGDTTLLDIINTKSTESTLGETKELDNYINTSKIKSTTIITKLDIGIMFQEQLQEELEEDTQLITQEELLHTTGFTSIITNK